MEEICSDVEVKVLGGLLLSPQSLARVSGLVSAEDFAQERHRAIYEAMLRLYRQHDPVTAEAVCAVLRRQKILDSVGGPDYLSSLCSSVGHQEGIEQEASMLSGMEAGSQSGAPSAARAVGSPNRFY